LGGIITLGNATPDEKIKIAFNFYDRDGSGSLDLFELRTFLRGYLRAS